MASLKEQSQQNTENYEKFLELGRDFNRKANHLSREEYYELAIENLTKAIEINPNKADAYLSRAAVYNNFAPILDDKSVIDSIENKAVGDYIKAIEIYTKGIELNESDSLMKLKSYFYRSDCYMALKEYDKAIADCTKAIELETICNFIVYGKRGKHYLNLGKYDEALADFNKNIELNLYDASAYIERAKAYYAYFKSVNYKEYSKKWDFFQKAIADYTKAIELSPNEADFYIKRADVYHYGNFVLLYEYGENDEICKSDAFNKALKNYDKAIELNPNSYEAYYSRAKLHHNFYDRELFSCEQALNCINDYTKVIELALDNYPYPCPLEPCGFNTFESNNSIFYYYRGECYEFLKEYSKAIADYSKYIELYNGDEDIYLRRARCYEALKEYDKAIADYSKMIESYDDKDAYFYRLRACCYEELKEYDKAITDYSKMIEISPRLSSYFRRANCYRHLKKYDEALADYSKAVESKNSEPEYYFGRGELYKELGNYELAFMDFDNGIKACKDSTEKEKYTKSAHDTAMSINDYNRAKNYLEQLTSLKEHKEVYLGNIDKAEQLEKLNQELKLEIQQKEAVEKRMQKLVEQFTHSLGNIIFPDTIYQVAERLKNLPECRRDTLLLHEAYHAEIIIKLQAELLRQRYSNTNPEKFRLMIRNCRRNANASEKTKTIEAVLNYAVSRVTARFLNQHYAGLETIRNKILTQTNTDLNQLKQKFEDDILLHNCLSPLEWVSQNLRPIQITQISPLWKKVFILSDSYAEALLFGYFSEILFNAFKYADHESDEFLTLSFAEETINEDIYLSCNWSNPTTHQKLSGLGTNQGLEAIAEDLKQLNNTEKPEQSLLIYQQDNQFQVTLFFKKDLLIDESNQLKIKRPVNRVEQE